MGLEFLCVGIGSRVWLLMLASYVCVICMRHMFAPYFCVICFCTQRCSHCHAVMRPCDAMGVLEEQF